MFAVKKKFFIRRIFQNTSTGTFLFYVFFENITCIPIIFLYILVYIVVVDACFRIENFITGSRRISILIVSTYLFIHPCIFIFGIRNTREQNSSSISKPI